MKFLLLLPVFILFGACAHYNDVRPGQRGVHRVVVRTEKNPDEATKSAMDQATHYCDEKRKEAIVLSIRKKNGKNKNSRRAIKVSYGANDAKSGGGYVVHMRFLCR